MRKVPDKTMTRISGLKDEIIDAKDEILGKVGAYNEKVQELTDLLEEVVSQQDDYLSERTDNWMESDKGSAYQEWRDQWSDMKDNFENLEEPDFPNEEQLDELENEPSA